MGFCGSFMGSYAVELGFGSSLIGVLSCISALSEVPILLFAGKLVDRFGEIPLLIFSGVMMSLRLFLTGMGLVPAMISAQLLQSVTYMTTYICCTQYISKETAIYLPDGSWVDFYTGERLEGGRWITAENRLDRIPLYLRENHAIPMFATAPMHIEDKPFEGLTIRMNLNTELKTAYYDDEINGRLQAMIQDDRLIAETSGMAIDAFEVYSEKEIRSCVVNGEEWKVEKLENSYRILPA